MMSTLQSQLTAIQAHSNQQLDLQAQKAQHGKSLLFEPREAARQSFDTIYQICIEGFEELCALDSRFAPFSRSLFSRDSIQSDRSQYTQQENEEISKIVEAFLGLLCGRLLLRPAMKAVEWLVRRWKVQEWDTRVLVLTFLPYHSHEIFRTLMSILPGKQLAEQFRWLAPYHAALESPPHHAIVQAAANRDGRLLETFSDFVLKTAKAGQHSTLLVSFWATVVAHALHYSLSTGPKSSSRKEMRNQSSEDTLLRVLPILQRAFSISKGQKDGAPEIYFAACMITTVLIGKAELEDRVLDAVMEAVAGAWTDETMTQGLSCLAMAAEEKEAVSLARRVTKALLSAQGSVDLLARISSQEGGIRVQKLVAGFALGLLKDRKANHALMVAEILDSELLAEQDATLVCSSVLSHVEDVESSGDSNALVQALTRYSAGSGTNVLQAAAKEGNVDLQRLIPGLAIETDGQEDDAMEVEPVAEQQAALSLDDTPHTIDLEALPQLPKEPTSFLDPTLDTKIFEAYLSGFQQYLSSRQALEAFLNITRLHRSERFQRPEFFTFLIRTWSGGSSSTAGRVRALDTAASDIASQDEAELFDPQEILPYVFSALADPTPKVRRAAADLMRAVDKAYKFQSSTQKQQFGISGSGDPKPRALSFEDAKRLTLLITEQILEESVLDQAHVVSGLSAILTGEDHHTDPHKQKTLKKQTRSDICLYLASHAAVTPTLKTTMLLLQVLNRVSAKGISAEAKKQFLLPFVRSWFGRSVAEVESRRQAEHITVSAFDSVVLGTLSHRSKEEIEAMKSLIRGEIAAEDRKEAVLPLVFTQFRHVYSGLVKSAQHEAQNDLLDLLLEIALQESQNQDAETRADLALQTLRTLSLPPETLTHLLDSLPPTSESEPAAKKRRIESARPLLVMDQDRLKAVVRRFTFVLEVAEGSLSASKAEKKHMQGEEVEALLKSLFHTLAELQRLKGATGSGLVYLFQTAMNCLLAVSDSLESASSTTTKSEAVRIDIIIETIRSSSSPQIQNIALLLIAKLASWQPELVLHGVIPLFTYMGSTLLQRQDQYSVDVMDQIVSSLAEALKQKKPATSLSSAKLPGVLAGPAKELMFSFVAAYEHVPLHRRLSLFENFVQSLGADDCLGIVVALLVDRYADSDINIDIFAAELTNRFGGDTALVAANQWLGLVRECSRTDTAAKKRYGVEAPDALLGWTEKTADEKTRSTQSQTVALASLLHDRTLRRRIAGEDSQRRLQKLLEQSLHLTETAASSATLQDSADELSRAVLGLIPTKDFIESSAQIMQAGSDAIRQQVFRSLEARVAEAKSSEREVFLTDVLDSCTAFVREDQSVPTRRAALSCIGGIISKFGKSETQAVLQAGQKVSSEAALGSSDSSLSAVSLQCLASVIRALGEEAVGLVGETGVIDKTLRYVRDGVDDEVEDACWSFLNTVLERIPWMVSAHALFEGLTISCRAVGAEGRSPVDHFCDAVAEIPSAETVFSAIESSWEAVLGLDNQRAAVGQLLTIMKNTISHNTKATIVKNAQSLFTIFLHAFDLRQQLQLDSSNGDDALFSLVNEIAIDMVLKLNDATFRPFFGQLVEWASQTPSEIGRMRRQVSVFSFAAELSNRLGGLVTSYAAYLVEVSASILEQTSTPSEDDKLKSTSQKLKQTTLRALEASFKDDQQDFWVRPEHFDTIASPLVRTLAAIESSADERRSETIAGLATAVSSSPEHLKTMNAILLSLFRHEQATVRLAAVTCQRNITTRLGLDWLALLPEMLPAISELLEDDDEDVERATLAWVREIEGITGEDLGGMLQ